MDIVKSYTTVKDEEIHKTALIATKSAFEKVVLALGLADTLALVDNKEFLHCFATEIVNQMKKKGCDNYNAIIGTDLVRVFRYQKESLITIKWKELVILLFQSPLNPQFEVDEKRSSDNALLEEKYHLIFHLLLLISYIYSYNRKRSLLKNTETMAFHCGSGFGLIDTEKAKEIIAEELAAQLLYSSVINGFL